MSSCFLKYDAAYQVKRLPRVCMKCGRESTEYVDLHLSGPRRGDGLVGLALDATGVNDGAIAEVRAPICDRHPLMGLMIPLAIVAFIVCALLVTLMMLIFPTWVGLWFVNLSLALAIVLFVFAAFSDIHAGRVEGDGVHVWGVSSRFVAAYEEFLDGREGRRAKRDRQRLKEAQHTQPGEKATLADDGTILQPAVDQRPKRERKKRHKRVRFENTQPKRKEVLRTLGYLGAAWLVVFLMFTFMFPPWTSKSYRSAKAKKRRTAEENRKKVANWFGDDDAQKSNDPAPVKQQPIVPAPVAAAVKSPSGLDGLIAYWPFDEGEGEQATDQSGRKQTAVVRRGEWIAGAKGKAVSLGGEGCFVELGTSADLNFTAGQPFTICGWAASRETTAVLVSFRNSKSPAPVIDIRIYRGKLVADVRADGTEFGPALLRTVPIADGEWTEQTSGLADGFAQANLVILPADWAADFLLFCQRNPKPCPLLDVTEPGMFTPARVAGDADLRTDVPRYRVWENGELVDEPNGISSL
eukprot:g8336.t1